jgi:hypothetical protein
VQHVRVGDDDPARVPRCHAQGGGRVPVVGEDAEGKAPAEGDLIELGLLVLGEGLRGEEVEGPGRRALQEGLDDGEVVAEGLPAGGRRDDDEVPAQPGHAVGLGLMRVEPARPAGGEGGRQPRVQVGWQGGPGGAAAGQALDMGQAGLDLRV